MEEQNDLFAPYSYKSLEIIKGEIDVKEYSGKFDSLETAKNWYRESGQWLEEKFNRCLVIIQ